MAGSKDIFHNFSLAYLCPLCNGAQCFAIDLGFVSQTLGVGNVNHGCRKEKERKAVNGNGAAKEERH